MKSQKSLYGPLTSKDGSKWTAVHKAGAAVLQVDMRAGHGIKAVPGSVVTVNGGIQVTAQMGRGGAGRALLAGENLFYSTLTAASEGQAIIGAQGDIALVAVTDDKPLNLGMNSFMASEPGVTMTSSMQKSARNACFSGEGLFVLKATGEGLLALDKPGAILFFELAAGEKRAVDNGHLVAWDATMNYRIGFASEAGKDGSSAAPEAAKSTMEVVTDFFRSNVISGEGFMAFFEGPGRVWVQAGATQRRA